MEPRRHARIKEIFLLAREHPPEEHAAVLDRMCDDETLRREVESFLERDRQAPPTPAATDHALPYPDQPPQIPNYRVLQKIGEGGMGEVYEAEQLEPVRRRVALKVLKNGFGGKEALARFESERQALAMMGHANIARVFEAGFTENGHPYLAMELIHGETITDYCDRHRLTNHDRLELLMRVCDGVQHAHQKGVIHRDLKPSNLLVAVDGNRAEPKIIDFGVAKAVVQPLTEHTLFTERGQWIGTPEYMSPEQAEMTGLDIDTRADVYSLGVLLYELLTGTRPFDSESFRTLPFDEMRRQIREHEPTRPSTKAGELGQSSQAAAHNRRVDVPTLVRQLRGDLDWIVLKALEKDRTRRYASPSELAADIGRYLGNEPVLARPPTATYRLGKFVKRHRVAVVTAALVTAALVLGLITTSYALVQAQREAARAKQVANFLEQLIADFSPYALTAASTDKLLDRAVARLEDELADQDLVRARLMLKLADAYRNRDMEERSLPLARRALAILRQELGNEDPEVASCLIELGWIAYEGGDYAQAPAYLQEAWEMQQKILPAEDLRILWGETDLGFMLWVKGDFAQAEDMLARALDALERHREADELDVSQTLFFQGVMYNNDGHYRRARSVLERSLKIRLDALDPDHIRVGWTLRTLARAQLLLGDHEQARRSALRAAEIMTESFGPDHSDLSFVWDILGFVHLELGQLDEAQALLERALTLRELSLVKDHPEIGISLAKLALFFLEIDRPEAAEPLLERALDIDRHRRVDYHPQLAWKLHLMSRQRAQVGLVDDALAWQQRALQTLEARFDRRHVMLAPHLAHLGVLLRDQGQIEPARTLLVQALELRRSQLGPEHRLIAELIQQLAVLHEQAGELDEAARAFTEAVTMLETLFGRDHRVVTRSSKARAAFLQRTGRAEQTTTSRPSASRP